MNYQKIRDVKNPTRAHSTDAGIDFFIPKDFKTTVLYPKSSILIPSGIIMELPKNNMGLFLNKSGIAAKKSLLLGAQVIDEGFRGEILINLHNIGRKEVVLKPNMKIVQMIIIPINLEPLTEVLKIGGETERKTGGFGSSGSF